MLAAVRGPLASAAIAALVCACGGGGGTPAPGEGVSTIVTATTVTTAVPAIPIPPVLPVVTPAPPPPSDDGVCSVPAQRARIRAYMDDQYFWYAQQGRPDQAAASIDAYYRSLLLQPADRYSFTQTTESFNQLFALGRRIGFGYTLVWNDAGQTLLRVRNIEPLSPIARAGIQRGDTVLSIDEYSPAQIAAGLVGPVSSAGISRLFQVRGADSQVRWITVVSQDYPSSPVSAVQVFTVTRGSTSFKAGYLAYQQFVAYSSQALGRAFEAFAAAGVQELILDLRYNGGGSVDISADLANLAGGASLANKVFAQLRFNSKHSDTDFAVRFPFVSGLLPAEPLSLKRVFVITSGSTASASELLINGLRPYLPVVLVGATTYGKPYGFIPESACGITFNTVNFESVNALGQGGFVNGIAADCQVVDDLDHALGDPQEARIQASLNYMMTGSCFGAALGRLSQAARAPVPESPVFGEPLPRQMFLR